MSEENNIVTQEEGSSVDFVKLFKDLVKHRKLYYKVLPIAFVISVIYTLSLPNYYLCTVKLSPELSGRRSSSMSQLAAAFGMSNARMAADEATEALFPTVYPELMNSVAFQTTLFPVKIHRMNSKKMMTYYEYMEKGQKAPWWAHVKSAVMSTIMYPFKLLFADKKRVKESSDTVNPFKLTEKQMAIAKAINSRVVCDVDKKSMIITINVVDQDPLIAATMADSVQTRLQDFITDYRTKKARIDYEFSQKVYQEAKERYEKARRKYASYADANRRAILESVRSEQSDLNTELQIQTQVYMKASTAMQQAEADIQREKPAFTLLEPATVPIQKAGPKRGRTCLIFLFLAFLGTSLWILYKEDDIKPLLGMS